MYVHILFSHFRRHEPVVDELEHVVPNLFDVFFTAVAVCLDWILPAVVHQAPECHLFFDNS